MAVWEFVVKEVIVARDEPVVVEVEEGYDPVSVDEETGLGYAMTGGRCLRITFARRR